MGNIKEIIIKNKTYYFLDDMINIKNFTSNLLKTGKKSCQHINIYYIGYIINKNSKYVNIHGVNPLYIMVNKVEGFIEEKDENKYLNFVSTKNNKEVLKKYIVLWNGIKI